MIEIPAAATRDQRFWLLKGVDPAALNYALLRKIRDQVTAHPETHHQATWGYRLPVNECATTLCIAGWAAAYTDDAPLSWGESGGLVGAMVRRDDPRYADYIQDAADTAPWRLARDPERAEVHVATVAAIELGLPLAASGHLFHAMEEPLALARLESLISLEALT